MISKQINQKHFPKIYKNKIKVSTPKPKINFLSIDLFFKISLPLQRLSSQVVQTPSTKSETIQSSHFLIAQPRIATLFSVTITKIQFKINKYFS